MDLHLPFGTCDPRSPLYVDREVQNELEMMMARDWSFTALIRGPRQMGKSSLLAWAQMTAEDIGRSVIMIDLQKYADAIREGQRPFLMSLAFTFAEWAKIANSEEVVEKAFGRTWRSANQTFLNFIEDQILPLIVNQNGKFIIMMDEVENIGNREEVDWASDFFAMLRTMHNDRAFKDEWRKVSILLSSAVEASALISNHNQSPFNVAELLVLKDFTQSQVTSLADAHVEALELLESNFVTPEEIDELHQLLGGHPFLTRYAFYLISKRTTWGEIKQNVTDEDGPFAEHLRNMILPCLRDEAMREALEQVEQGEWEHDVVFHALESGGIVKPATSDSPARFRNELYHQYYLLRR